MATELERLHVLIEANTKSYERAMVKLGQKTTKGTRVAARGFRKLDKRMLTTQRIASGFVKSFLAGFGVAGVAGLSIFISRSIEAANVLQDTADKLGLNTEALQEYRFAAASVGIAQNTLDMGLQRFVRRVGEARQGTGELKDTLKQYNIALNNANGTARSTDEILGDLADAAKDTNDANEQLRIGFKAFDSEGAGLINILKRGREGMAKLRQEARDLGAVISAHTIKRLAEANTEIKKMQNVVGAQLTVALADIAPLLVSFAQGLANVARFASSAAKALGSTASMSTEELKKNIAALKEMLAEGGGSTPFQGPEGLNKTLADMEKLLALRLKLDETKPPPGGAAPSVENQKKVDALLKSLIQQNAQLDLQNIILGRTEGEKARLTVLDLLNTAKREGIKLSETDIKIIQRTAIVIGEQTAALEASRKRMEVFKKVGQDVASSLDAAFAEWAETGKLNVKNMVKSMLLDLAKLTFKQTISGGLSKLVTSVLSGGQGTSVSQKNPFSFGGFRAAGGAVSPGKSYVVGERGRELFMPDVPGNIIPNGSSPSASVKIEVINNAGVQVQQRQEQRGGQAVTQLILDVVNGAAETGGLKGMESHFGLSPAMARR